MSQVASIIREQIGGSSLYMIGARQLIAGENSLTFKIMRNVKGVTHVTVTLTPMDDYIVTFTAIRACKVTKKAEVAGVYCDMLRTVIEENTGLYTRL